MLHLHFAARDRAGIKPFYYAEIPGGLYVTPRGLIVAGTVTLAATGGQLGVILYEALTGLRRAPKGHVEIEVTFEINTDGIDQTTNNENCLRRRRM